MGVGGRGGGGSKVFTEQAASNQRHNSVTPTPGRMVTHQAADFSVGGSNPGWWTPAAAPLPYWPHKGSNRRPKTSAADCITIRPLRILRLHVLPTAWIRVCH